MVEVFELREEKVKEELYQEAGPLPKIIVHYFDSAGNQLYTYNTEENRDKFKIQRLDPNSWIVGCSDQPPYNIAGITSLGDPGEALKRIRPATTFTNPQIELERVGPNTFKVRLLKYEGEETQAVIELWEGLKTGAVKNALTNEVINFGGKQRLAQTKKQYVVSLLN